MTAFLRRAIWVVLLIAAANGCGGRAPTASAQPSATITLTETACVADGLGAVISDHFVVTLVNNAPYAGLYNMRRMNDGHAYQELELFIAEQQRRFLTGTEQMDPPTFASTFATRNVDPMTTERSEMTLPSGTYGLVCRGLKTAELWSAYVVGPLRVP
jgi:hypothetical protein